MLNETEEFLNKIKNQTKTKQLLKEVKKTRVKKIKKMTIKTLIVIFIALTLFFPHEVGTIIGVWINEFFSTIYKNIIK